MDAFLAALTEELFWFAIELPLSLYIEVVIAMHDDVLMIANISPDAWLGGEPWALVTAISENVMVPIAGIILTYVFCMDLISLVIDKNKMSEVDTEMLLKCIFKMMICVFILTKTLPIIAGIFQVGAKVINDASEVLGSRNFSEAMGNASDIVQNLKDGSAGTVGEIGRVMTLWMMVNLSTIMMYIISICAKLAIYGRMIEIMLYCSVGPIPFATMGNKEWSSICVNYIKSLFALAFQGFLIMFVVQLYAIILTQSSLDFSSIGSTIWSIFAQTGWGILLCFGLFKTGNIAKSIFNAH